MFVTSDIFDLKAIGRFRGVDWREHLLSGVEVHGTHWPDYPTGARFLLEAAKRCGLVDEMRWAGYNRPESWRTKPLSPKSFERLIRRELSGAKEAESVLLTGIRSVAGTETGAINFGGEAGSIRARRGPTGPIPVPGPPWRFSADFVFPLDEDPAQVANDLFRLAVDILGAEYGYHFVRDEMCNPSTYCHGIVAPLDYKALSDRDGQEISDWADFVSDGRLWSGPWPLLRDLFQVNLLSERHMTPIEGLGRLTEWVPAQPGRGRLEAIGLGRWVWTLTDAEMIAVRPLLNQAGLLHSCHDRVYRDLPNGGLA